MKRISLAALITATLCGNAWATPIGEAKAAGPGWSGAVQGIVVAIQTEANSFVLEEESRSAAITVYPLPLRDLKPGDEVMVSGALQSDGRLQAYALVRMGRSGVAVGPLGMSNRDITGATNREGLRNLDMLIRTWGRILDEPAPFPDGSRRFHISDGTATAAEGSLFRDDFSAGRDSRWRDFAGTSMVQGGLLVAGDALNIVCAEGITAKDLTAGVDCVAGVQFGVVLRYEDNNNFVLAFYAPSTSLGPILGFHERLNGNWGTWVNPVGAPALEGTLRLTARVSGPVAVASLTDGKRTYSTSCTLTTLLTQGLFGLYHDTSTGPDPARFDNFAATGRVDPDVVQVIAPRGMEAFSPGSVGQVVEVTGISGRSLALEDPVRSVTLVSGAIVPRGYFPPVVVAPDSSGDFGPQTPGTRTAGIQEAINYCVANDRDLYIRGGWLGPVYNIADTIRVPPAEDFKVDGGVYVLNYTGPSDRDMLVFDSSRNCDYKFGLIVYGGSQSSIRVLPMNHIPNGGPRSFTGNRMRFEVATDPSPFTPGPRPGLGAVVFDSSQGPIENNDIYFVAAMNFAVDMMTTGAFGFCGNRVWNNHLHANATESTLLKLSPQTEQNEFYLAMGVDQGATGVKGVDIEGSNNLFDLIVRNGFDSPQVVILRPGARGNVLNISPLSGVRVTDLITDQALDSTNRVTSAGTLPHPQTITVSAGTFSYTQRLWPAVAVVSGGQVSSVSLTRGSASLDYTDSASEGILLSPGDTLRISSTAAPQLRVLPHKVR